MILSSLDPVSLTLLSTLCFSIASLIFTDFSKLLNPFWVNAFKASIGLVLFWSTVFLFQLTFQVSWQSFFAFTLSGALGLMIADIFMLKAMSFIGASRMLMFFGLQPFILGLTSYLFFQQQFYAHHFYGLISIIFCIAIISFENFKRDGHFNLEGVKFGVIAVTLDAFGVLLTRYGFDHTPGISPITGNAYRCLGAIAMLTCMQLVYKKFDFKSNWLKLSRLDQIKISFGASLGVYFALMFYLTAISRGNLALVSSVVIAAPMFAAFFECLRARKWPSLYLLLSFTFFITGYFLLKN